MNHDKLNFSYNWNNKLDCAVFTTLRLHNPKIYYAGALKSVYLKDVYKKDVEIMAVKKMLLGSITEYTAGVDTGYSAQECQKLIKTMYKSRNINWATQLLDFMLLKTIKK